MKLERTNYTNGYTYITIRSEFANEAIVIVTDGDRIIELKGTNLILKGGKDE